MANYPIRRSQLVAPFGVGGMVVVQKGISLIAAGLDHWYEFEETGIDRKVEPDEFRIEEWRLQQVLAVDHFRLPPDFREKKMGEDVPNSGLMQPFLRFPQWHFCQSCKRLERQPLSARGSIPCDECRSNRKTRYLVQVPFVAMCDNGHLQDFPWREWVHRTANTACEMTIRLIATGGSSLADQKVLCDCGVERTLASITGASPDGTELTKRLDASAVPFLCEGKAPWLGIEARGVCDRPLRGSLRSASNIYFADVRSAIYLPRGNERVSSELISILENPPLSTLIQLLKSVGKIDVSFLRSQHSEILKRFDDLTLKAGLEVVFSTRMDPDQSIEDLDEDRETSFRRAEYRILREPKREEQLLLEATNITDYAENISRFFSRIMLAKKLRETRALAGFTRVFPENGQSIEVKRKMLRKMAIEREWLPAYIVFGEGIFFQFNEERLSAWESQKDVIARITQMAQRYKSVQRTRLLRQRDISPRSVLLHSVSHLLMNRLTFECGYSSAALRERLYVSQKRDHPMCGILIYTAAGDAEGTLGGLVRMGKPGYLEPIFGRALSDAHWCSADPVCMEMGVGGGQGPDSCNLAACHNCCLVPETACEEFNRFLDRGVVIGEPKNRSLGYFE